MNKDQIKGRAKEVKGSAKEVAGKVTGKESLEQKGRMEKAAGKAQAGYGDVKKDMKDASDKIKKGK
ncbi:MAG: CsbD family protein [Woeseia sp.]